jgi:hypothetical protein
MNRRLVILSAIAVLLAVYLLLAGDGGKNSVSPGMNEVPQTAQDAEAPTPAQRLDAKLNPLDPLDPQSFTAILERPLFDQSRQKREEEPPPPPPPATDEPPPVTEELQPTASDYQLLAIAGGPAGRVAAVRFVPTDDVLYLREGQLIEPWRVLSIRERSVVIGSAEHNIEISMFETVGQPGTGEASPAPAE